ncbi:MAG: methyltransferase GidB [Pseudonocardiales bacterium]|nr:methyltransferase GidB [Pseudonocardiales bacterium]
MFVAELPAPEIATMVAVFGAGLEHATRYAALLADQGVLRGLIGPRETERLWDRHLLNSAVIAELIPVGARVVDVGSGAGLPGIPLACARPDLSVDLLDTLARRTDFLSEAVAELGLADRVRITTGRVEDASVVDKLGRSDWVTARAVAPLDRLARWCLPLLAPGGFLLAMKGQKAEEEIVTHSRAVLRAGGNIVDVVRCGTGLIDEPARVVRIAKR